VPELSLVIRNGVQSAQAALAMTQQSIEEFMVKELKRPLDIKPGPVISVATMQSEYAAWCCVNKHWNHPLVKYCILCHWQRRPWPPPFNISKRNASKVIVKKQPASRTRSAGR
jgi:hypothetical protein